MSKDVYITGEPDFDVVSKYLDEVILKNKLNPLHPETFCEIKVIEDNGEKCHMLILNDRLIAAVVERRTEFNNIEYTLLEYETE